MTDRPRCHATNRRGAPCGAPVVTGTTPPACMSHAPRDLQESKGFGGSQPGAGRPRMPSPTEVARRIIEDHVVHVLRPYFRSIGLDLIAQGPGERPTVVEMPEGGAKVVGKDPFGGVHVSAIDDLGGQIAAAEKLLDRVFGKPKQTQEVTGAGGEPLTMGGATVIVPADEGAVARLLQQTGALDATRAQREE